MDEKKDMLPAAVFLKAVNAFFDLIREIDASMSNSSRGLIAWNIRELRKNSPAIWAVDGVVRKKGVQSEYPAMVQSAVVGGIEVLGTQPDIPPYFTFDALRELRVVGRQHSRVQELVVYTEFHSGLLNKALLANVEAILGDSTVTLGSLEGRLQAINVHTVPVFRIYNPQFPKGVSCRFTKTKLDHAISGLDRDVLVWGKIHRNRKGIAQQVVAEDFEILSPEPIPSISEMSGLVHNMTNGLSLKEYLETLRDG